MGQETERIVWLQEARDRNDIGEKGKALSQLTMAGLPVPAAFIVPNGTFEQYLKESGLLLFITRAFKTLDHGDMVTFVQAAASIEEKIMQTPLPAPLKTGLRQAYETLKQAERGTFKEIIVRVSTSEESLPVAAIPHLKTIAALEKAILKIYATTFSAKYLSYLYEQSNGPYQPLAIIVQLMICPKKSGLIHTTDPVTGTLSIMSLHGAIQPLFRQALKADRHAIEKDADSLIGQDINTQRWQLDLISGKRAHSKVPKLDQTSQKLNQEEIQTLTQFGKQIEDYFGFPVEVEWVIDDNRKTWILHVSPIFPPRQVKAVQVPLRQGKPASFGYASGPIRIITEPHELSTVQNGEIVVSELPLANLDSLGSRPSAFIIETGASSHPFSQEVTKRAIPTVVGTGNFIDQVKNGLIVTVDGRTGDIYQGKPPYMPPLPSRLSEALHGGVKVYSAPRAIDGIRGVTSPPIDGSVIAGDLLLTRKGQHPRSFLRAGQSRYLRQELGEGLRTIAGSHYPRKVIYRLSDRHASDYRTLSEGEKYETTEGHPLLGYRGVLRHLQEPDLLQLELEAFEQAKLDGLTNLELMLPYLRTYGEYERLRHFLPNTRLRQVANTRAWFLCQTPANVLLLNTFCETGNLAGVYLDVDHLLQLTLGMDMATYEQLGEQTLDNEALLMSFRHIIDVCRYYSLPLLVAGQLLEESPTLLEFFIGQGVTGFVVSSDNVEPIQRFIPSAEAELELNRTIEALHQD